VKRHFRFKTRATALVIAGIAVVVIVSTAAAGPAGTVKTFTGCLVTGDGVIIKVKEGDSPKSACTSGQTLARLSGGDITKISVTGGLTLTNGGESGDVEINLDPKYSLPQGCADGRIAEWDTGPDPDRWICGVDSDTTYTAGTGLDLSNANQFSIESGYRIPGKSCPTGEFSKGFDSNGVIQCAAPTASSAGIEVWQMTNPAIDAGTVIKLPEGEGRDLVIMPLPAGTFLVTASADLVDDNDDDELTVRCNLRNGAFTALPVQPMGTDIGDGVFKARATVTVQGVVTLASPDNVRFTCFSDNAGDPPDAAYSGTVTAIKVGTLHTP
jgi:hypothetical protein